MSAERTMSEVVIRQMEREVERLQRLHAELIYRVLVLEDAAMVGDSYQRQLENVFSAVYDLRPERRPSWWKDQRNVTLPGASAPGGGGK